MKWIFIIRVNNIVIKRIKKYIKGCKNKKYILFVCKLNLYIVNDLNEDVN